MDSKQRWVVALDDTEMDNYLLKYVHGLCQFFTPERIYFVNVLKEKKSYSYLPEEYFDFMNQVEEDIKLRMDAKVDKYLGKVNIKFELLVGYGTPFEEIVHVAMNKSVSLVIAGRKRQSDGSGVVSDRLSRNLPCDVLIVPEEVECRIDNVLVPTDFSEHSQLALKHALGIREVNKKTNIYVFHAYEVPIGYSKSGKSYSEFAEVMKSNAGKEMKRWMREVSGDINSILLLNEHSLADLVASISTERSIDLIIMGSKGQTAASLALLGSQTMKVVGKNNRIPLLIAKKPGENINFIQALKQI